MLAVKGLELLVVRSERNPSRGLLGAEGAHNVVMLRLLVCRVGCLVCVVSDGTANLCADGVETIMRPSLTLFRPTIYKFRNGEVCAITRTK